jgi:hypothetical protein
VGQRRNSFEGCYGKVNLSRWKRLDTQACCDFILADHCGIKPWKGLLGMIPWFLNSLLDFERLICRIVQHCI